MNKTDPIGFVNVRGPNRNPARAKCQDRLLTTAQPGAPGVVRLNLADKTSCLWVDLDAGAVQRLIERLTILSETQE